MSISLADKKGFERRLKRSIDQAKQRQKFRDEARKDAHERALRGSETKRKNGASDGSGTA